MAKKQTRNTLSVEAKVMASLGARGSHAMTEQELQMASGITGTSFKEVLIRLVRKGMVAKWKNERQCNYIVDTTFAHEAHYHDEIVLDALYVGLGHASGAITIKRTIPFVLSPDDETGKLYHNRYKAIKADSGH